MSVKLITKYFPNLSSRQIEQFEALQDLYEEWNQQINVISRKDIDQLYERHVLHSLAIAKFIDFKAGSEVLDIGTGGGFPGIPLAIIFPDVKFTLVDSIGKKIKVVNEISQSLELDNVVAYHQRAEKVKGKFDMVVSRAVTRLGAFIPWTNGKFKTKMINAIPNGIIYLKGGDIREEIAEVKRASDIIELKSYFEEEFFDTKKIVYVKMV